jgi:uncharacterized membrane protein YccC
MPPLTWHDAVFSAKTFGAAMLAVYVAFRLQLPQPGWAMLTVYIVSQPLAGMVLSKSVFRAVGTVIGAVFALMAVDLFADARELFVLVIALWVGACTYVAVYLRDAPASYGAMLSGYTAAIIGFPAVLAPLTAFDTAVARCLEILLGVGCATLVSRIVFPRTAGAALEATVDACLTAARQWIGDTLRGEERGPKGIADRRKLLADVIALDALRVHAAFDTPEIRSARYAVRHLQGRLLTLLTLLVSVHDRLATLRREQPQTAESLAPLFARMAHHLDSAHLDPDALGLPDADETTRLRTEITDRLPDFAAMTRHPDAITERALLLRLRDLLDVWREILHRRAHRLSGAQWPETEAAPATVRYRDYRLAAVAAFISVTSVIVTAAFWIMTGWEQGSTAVFLAAVVASIMASLDDPAAAATGFLKMSALSSGIAAFYLFAVFPLIDGFPLLVVSLMLFLLPFGMVLPVPRTGTLFLPLGLNFIALLGLSNVYTANFADFLNGTLALLFGIGSSVFLFRLLRPIGIRWTVHRLVTDALSDLACLAADPVPEPRLGFEGRMFDRINGLMMRLDPANPDQRPVLLGCLASVRVGLNILALRRDAAGLPRDMAEPIDRMLSRLAGHFRRLARGTESRFAQREFADLQDRLMTAGPQAADMVLALSGIAGSLAQHPDFFAAAVDEPEPVAVAAQTMPNQNVTP